MADKTAPEPAGSANEPTPVTDMPPFEMDAQTRQLLTQMQEMQAQIDALRASQPAPPNLVSAAVRDLTDHLNARAAQYPDVNFSEVWDAVKTLAEDAAHHPSEVASLVKETVHELADLHPGKEFGYLRQLATGFVKENLKALAGI